MTEFIPFSHATHSNMQITDAFNLNINNMNIDYINIICISLHKVNYILGSCISGPPGSPNNLLSCVIHKDF